jgi:2-polyprenyl-3-methyl-5-hydroxy-6-metoxy-1,4-benzoquinol methylase
MPGETTIAPSLSAAQDEARGGSSMAANRGKRIGILIVAYNAVTTLARVFQRIKPEVWDNVEEVVVFDDASQDNTYELAVGYKTLQGVPKLNVIKNQKNLGYGGNQKAGYRYFAEKGFDVVVLLHGDGQYAPEILAEMYHPLVTGEADAVFGSRMMKAHGGPLKGGMPLYKFAGNQILTTIENRALGMNLTEFHSGYRAYSLAALRRLDLSRMTNDFHFDTEIIVKLHHQGFRIREIPIPTYYGTEICYVNGMKYAADVVRAIWRYKSTVHSGTAYPEFQEYFIHYPLKESKYSSHYYFQQLSGRGHDVLDIGCGEGFMAEKIAAQNNRVTGVDILPEPARSRAFTDYIAADLSHGLGDASERLRGRQFDKILLMDVLEHLVRPETLLADCRQFLGPEGTLLVSVPNVANITVRLSLLFGRFQYQPRGILDRTHLRFFTRKTARRLIEEAGYEVVREVTTVMPVELTCGLSADNRLMIAANRILHVCTRLLPGLFGYQSVFLARLRNRAA